MKNLAPIVLFAYVRLNILKKTINNLKKSDLSKLSNLYIFSDGYKSNLDKKNVNNVRRYLKKIKGFNKIKIILRKKNLGLAKNIIQGVTEVIQKYEKVIVLEDDIFVSPNFLNFMNVSLDKYKNEKKIWHINGWNYDLKFPKSNYNTFFCRGMYCWGWATWKNRWKKYKKNPKYLIKKWSKNKIKKFNFDNSTNYWSQIIRNYNKSINTWAVFWYSSIFNNKGLCLSPVESLTKNIGNDNFSTHQINRENSENKISKKFFIRKKINFTFSKKVKENEIYFRYIKKKLLFKLSFKSKIKTFLNI